MRRVADDAGHLDLVGRRAVAQDRRPQLIECARTHAVNHHSSCIPQHTPRSYQSCAYMPCEACVACVRRECRVPMPFFTRKEL